MRPIGSKPVKRGTRLTFGAGREDGVKSGGDGVEVAYTAGAGGGGREHRGGVRSIWWAALAAAAVLVLQLVMMALIRRTGNRAVLVGGAALLLTGHQPQRMRSPKHESLETLLLRDRAAAVGLTSTVKPAQP